MIHLVEHDAVRAKVRLAVTLGDPAGIGPEVAEAGCRALLEAVPAVSIVLCGPQGLADVLAGRLGGERVRAVTQERFTGPRGVASAEGGRAALAALTCGIRLAQRAEVDALVTAPLNKEAIALCGSEDRGHTEILARELGAGGPVAMAFFSRSLRVVLATAHIPLRDVMTALTPERIVDVARLLNNALLPVASADTATQNPHLALAGLNPHAGEAGLLGSEEETTLVPALRTLSEQGVRISGPVPPDTVFLRAARGEYDGVVALYHDQGLIPVKLLDFGEAVNVTLGLRVPRTSPGHGTAYDLVGTGTPSPAGMTRALQTAVELGARRVERP